MPQGFLDSFERAMPQGMQLGMQGAEMQRQQELRKQQQQMQMMKTLGDVMGLPPGPQKDMVLSLVSQQWESMGNSMPKEFWSSIKKADEDQMQQFQGLAETMTQAGVQMTPQSLSTLMRQPDMLVNFMKMHSQAQSMKAAQQEQQTIKQIAGMGSQPPDVPGPAPQAGAEPPQAAVQSRIGQLTRQLDAAMASGIASEPFNRYVDNLRQQLQQLTGREQFVRTEERQARQHAENLAQQKAQSNASLGLQRQRFEWERSPEKQRLELEKSRQQGLTAEMAKANMPIPPKDTSSFVQVDALREGRLEYPPQNATPQQLREGNYRPIDDKQKVRLEGTAAAQSLVSDLKGLSQGVITAANGRDAWEEWAVRNKEARLNVKTAPSVYRQERDAFTGNLARSLGSERGVLTDRDIERVGNGLPKFGDTVQVRDMKWQIIENLISVEKEASTRLIAGDKPGETKRTARKNISSMLEELDRLNVPPPKEEAAPEAPGAENGPARDYLEKLKAAREKAKGMSTEELWNFFGGKKE